MSIPIIDNVMQTEIDQIYFLFDLCAKRGISLTFSRYDFQNELLKASDRVRTVNSFRTRLFHCSYSVPNGDTLPREPQLTNWD